MGAGTGAGDLDCRMREGSGCCWNQIERRLREGRRLGGRCGYGPGRRRRGGRRLSRRRAQAASAAVPHFLEINQEIGQSAFDRFEMAEPRIRSVELLRQLGDAIFQRAERKLIALRQLHAVKPFAQLPDRAFQFGRHRATALHQGGDARFQPGQRLAAAFDSGALELRAKPAHLGGELRQRAVGEATLRDDAAQRDHRLLELLETPIQDRPAATRPRRPTGRFCDRGQRTASSKPPRAFSRA